MSNILQCPICHSRIVFGRDRVFKYIAAKIIKSDVFSIYISFQCPDCKAVTDSNFFTTKDPRKHMREVNIYKKTKKQFDESDKKFGKVA